MRFTLGHARKRRIWLRTQAGAATLAVALSAGVGAASAHHVEQQPTGGYPKDGSTPDDGYLLLPEQWHPTVKVRADAASLTDAAQVSDRVKLRYQVRFGDRVPTGAPPLAPGLEATRLETREPGRRYPALLVLDGYNHRVEDSFLQTHRKALFAAGYAIVKVNVRGTGCSSGHFDPFSPTEAKDAAAVIDWIAEREWSDGNVALLGASYSAIEAFIAAPERPASLRAVSTIAPVTDIYRDIARPGGMLNAGAPAAFEYLRTVANAVATIDRDDEVCFQHQSARAQDKLAAPGAFFAQHPYDDEFMRTRSSIHRAHLIDVPVQTFISWQDNVLGSRAVEVLERLPAPYYAMLTNGDHHAFAGVLETEVIPFLDRYVKGVQNGYETTPRVRVLWDAQATKIEVSPDTFIPGPPKGAWTSSFDQWPPPPAKPEVWHLEAGGRLTPQPAQVGADTYTYVPGSGQSPGTPELTPAYDPWPLGPASGASLSYTSAPLERDASVLGSASLDLSLSSTEPDTDVQAVLTEVRADGQEVYVQRGWLRASHRELDLQRSTDTRPYHVHRAPDDSPSTPLADVPMRVEIRPFGHVFRAGSRIRVYVEAPSLVPDYFGFASLPTPARNTVHTGGATGSRLVLPVLAGHPAKAPLPACTGPDVPMRYRCRPAG